MVDDVAACLHGSVCTRHVVHVVHVCVYNKWLSIMYVRITSG